jgi:hypothetical protein
LNTPSIILCIGHTLTRIKRMSLVRQKEKECLIDFIE